MFRSSLDFENVFAESSPFVWRVLGRLGVRASDLSDVSQEVFLVVHRRLGDYDGRAPLRAWIYGICVRAAAAYRKRAHRRHERSAALLPDRSTPAPQGRDVDVARARARLHAVLAELDAGKREVFVLYELEELSMREVAEVLDCPLQTAYSRLLAARKAVTAAFRGYEQPEDAP